MNGAHDGIDENSVAALGANLSTFAGPQACRLPSGLLSTRTTGPTPGVVIRHVTPSHCDRFTSERWGNRLAGSPDESGRKRREKGLARSGNGRVRRGMVQLADIAAADSLKVLPPPRTVIGTPSQAYEQGRN